MQTNASATSSVAHSDYTSSVEALAILGVKPQTLYSYVSRGMIRRICIDGKASLYNREDVRKLKARSTARSGHGAVAGGALQWGEPVLVTALTEITSKGPRYRQRLALDLAREGYSFESVAEYLWSKGELARDTRWAFDDFMLRTSPQVAALTQAYPRIHFRQLLTEIVLLLCIEHGHYQGDALKQSLKPAQILVQALCIAFGFVGPRRNFVPPKDQENIANYILRAFGIDANEPQVRVLNAAMVILLDHEFSPATFAARIAASSGVDLHSCIGAALQVHFGSALGLRCDLVEQALELAASAKGRAAQAAFKNVGPVGFNHPLYVDGDPRAAEIVRLALSLHEHKSECQKALQTLQYIDNHGGSVSLNAAMIVLSRALGLKGLVAGGLLTVSRSAGWIAHVIEQYEQDFMIRPRGKFSPPGRGLDQSAA